VSRVETSLLGILGILHLEELVSITKIGVPTMTFVFYCHGCGSLLYEDPKPVLYDGTYRKETYVQSVILKIGGECPRCRRRLCSIPLEINVVASKSSTVRGGRKSMRSLPYCAVGQG
jgi:hypothetical protein